MCPLPQNIEGIERCRAFSGQDSPARSYRCRLSADAINFDVYLIMLSILILTDKPGLGMRSFLPNLHQQAVIICLIISEHRFKNLCFVLPAGMVSIERVFPEFSRV